MKTFDCPVKYFYIWMNLNIKSSFFYSSIKLMGVITVIHIHSHIRKHTYTQWYTHYVTCRYIIYIAYLQNSVPLNLVLPISGEYGHFQTISRADILKWDRKTTPRKIRCRDTCIRRKMLERNLSYGFYSEGILLFFDLFHTYDNDHARAPP